MKIGDLVKVFSSISEFDGQMGRIMELDSSSIIVQFAEGSRESFYERDIVSMQPLLEPIWLKESIATTHASHGACRSVQTYLGRIIAARFIHNERRRLLSRDRNEAQRWGRLVLTEREYARLGMEGFSPCLQCGQIFCHHRY